jgi:hypothetical protein
MSQAGVLGSGIPVAVSCPAKRPPGLKAAMMRAQSAENPPAGQSGKAKPALTRSRGGSGASPIRAIRVSNTPLEGRSARARRWAMAAGSASTASSGAAVRPCRVPRRSRDRRQSLSRPRPRTGRARPAMCPVAAAPLSSRNRRPSPCPGWSSRHHAAPPCPEFSGPAPRPGSRAPGRRRNPRETCGFAAPRPWAGRAGHDGTRPYDR